MERNWHSLRSALNGSSEGKEESPDWQAFGAALIEGADAAEAEAVSWRHLEMWRTGEEVSSPSASHPLTSATAAKALLPHVRERLVEAWPALQCREAQAASALAAASLQKRFENVAARVSRELPLERQRGRSKAASVVSDAMLSPLAFNQHFSEQVADAAEAARGPGDSARGEAVVVGVRSPSAPLRSVEKGIGEVSSGVFFKEQTRGPASTRLRLMRVFSCRSLDTSLRTVRVWRRRCVEALQRSRLQSAATGTHPSPVRSGEMFSGISARKLAARRG